MEFDIGLEMLMIDSKCHCRLESDKNMINDQRHLNDKWEKNERRKKTRLDAFPPTILTNLQRLSLDFGWWSTVTARAKQVVITSPDFLQRWLVTIERWRKDDLRIPNGREDDLPSSVDVLSQEIFVDSRWFVHVVEESKQEEEESAV